MTKTSAFRVVDLTHSKPTPFALTPGAQACAQIRDTLDLVDLRKLRFEGQIAPLGKSDWQLTARLGATVVQPCVSTLQDVQTRIDIEVRRTYLAGLEDPDDPDLEMPEDDTVEALRAVIDPNEVMQEALSLALPLYPKADATSPVTLQVTEPGKTPLTDQDTKPFAALAGLRDKLEGGPSE
ncbi:MAG: DUF177 domain-containing protein [Paracoccaceae bacterium]